MSAVLRHLRIVLPWLWCCLRLGRHAVKRLKGKLTRHTRRVERELVRLLCRRLVPPISRHALRLVDLNGVSVSLLVGDWRVGARSNVCRGLRVVASAINVVTSVFALTANLGHLVAMSWLNGRMLNLVLARPWVTGAWEGG